MFKDGGWVVNIQEPGTYLIRNMGPDVSGVSIESYEDETKKSCLNCRFSVFQDSPDPETGITYGRCNYDRIKQGAWLPEWLVEILNDHLISYPKSDPRSLDTSPGGGHYRDGKCKAWESREGGHSE